MDLLAFVRLVPRARATSHEESIGTALYQNAYMPLRDRSGQVLGHLSLPAFADQRQQEQERSGVLIAVVNLFVLLFALSVLVALFISNWTTRPLDLLKRSLASVELKGTDRKLRYRGRDEVGQLVEVYNRKVEELRVSAEKLAQSERESAWKEMARQVAHEIKNPLTPMKLSIQHFQQTQTWLQRARGNARNCRSNNRVLPNGQSSAYFRADAASIVPHDHRPRRSGADIRAALRACARLLR
ncbi:MAG: HAMP domain-containing protein [Flavobacteriales bacterium]|nr:HAMP domain-containing protein [Flavobacteriales bacterium]